MTKDLRQTIPIAARPVYDEITRLTDAFSRQHLDEEYAQLARQMTAALARKRPSPLERGRIDIWACGIVYALGTVNFLFDPSQEPHLTAKELCELFEVSQQSASNRAREVRKTLGIGQLDPDWFRPSQLENNPVVWFVETPEGFILDARNLPRELQEELAEAGIIPFVPEASAELAEAENESAEEQPPLDRKKPASPPSKIQIGFDL